MDTPQVTFQVLEKIKMQGSTTQKIGLRCQIILTYLKRKHVELVAQDLGCHSNTVYKWIRRWTAALPLVLNQWDDEGFNRETAIRAILQDAPRSGTPSVYTPEQITQFIALACRSPEEFGRPITHWTMAELAEELVKQGIVEKVSETSLRRFLKSGRFETTQKPLLVEPQNR